MGEEMKEKSTTILAWILFGGITVSAGAALLIGLLTRPADDPLRLIEVVLILSVPLSFSFVGALIISKQPRNAIGWLSLGPGFSIFVLTDALLYPYYFGGLLPPASPSWGFLLLVWFSNWNWLLLVFPLMFIMVLFPTGRPFSRRWRGLILYGLSLMVTFILLVTFAEFLAPPVEGVEWRIANPIGFLEIRWFDVFIPPFLILLPLWVILCVVALLVRFRRSRGVERAQIKWLFFAAAVFALTYVPTFLGDSFGDFEDFWNNLFIVGLLVFPISIAVAILRYRLYDIDIIIRRTLQYAMVTGILALAYFGGIIVLQGILGPLTGSANSPVVTVITTLGIAALFNPLRTRVQDFIDQRFYRRKYDAEQTLAQFAETARDEMDVDHLSNELLGVVDETMQPEQVSLWIRK